MITAILFIFLISFGIGLPLVLLLVPKHNIWGKLGLSYLLGVGMFTLLIYITNLLSLKITALNVILLLILFSAPLLFFRYKKIKDFKNEIAKSLKKNKLDYVDKLLLAAIAFFVISSFLNTFYWPVYKWDSLTLYDFRAHVFVQKGFINVALETIKDGFYLVYPLLTSLLHSIVYLFGGSNPKFIYSLYYISSGLVYYGLLREFVSRKLSLIFTFMLITVPQIFEQSLISYTNLPYVNYFSLGAIYLLIWDKKGDLGYLLLSALLLGLSTWTRSTEPFWLAILGVVILIAVYKKKLWSIVVFIVFFLPIQQVWKSYLVTGLIQNTTPAGEVGYGLLLKNLFNWGRWSEVFSFLYPNVILVWGPVFLLYLVSLLYVIFKKAKDLLSIYLISILLLLFIFIGTFGLSFIYPSWSEVPDSASRTTMVVYPLFIFSSALVISKIDNVE